MSKRVFISYDYETDGDFVNGIRGMIHNSNVDVDFYDESVKTPINSSDSAYIKRKITDKIERASTLLCIVGRNTNSSEWVEWEVNQAKNLNKTIVFMRRKSDYSSSMPNKVLGYKIIKNWDLDFLESL